MSLTPASAIASILASFNKRNVGDLRRINDECIEEYAITEGQVYLELSILSYSFAKIVGKPRYWDSPKRMNYMKKMSSSIAELSIELRSIPDDIAAKKIVSILKSVEHLDQSDQRYVRSLEAKARLKIASILYAKGLSLSKAVEMTGADKRDLMEFSGATTMFDRASTGRKFTERLKDARKIFT
ncbi:Uncharacterised protein [Candidatus Gugararchaeum adminiculabundum]|nr:Uncharacterised protein [Candidatus Gugararchaeum adminiculabundum]